MKKESTMIILSDDIIFRKAVIHLNVFFNYKTVKGTKLS